MGVIIAGAGSVGLLLASFLAESGIEVSMLVRRKEQAALISKKGIERVNVDGTKVVTAVLAVTEFSQLPSSSLWIVAVKSFDVPTLLELMAENNVSKPVLFIQNGMSHYILATQSNLPHLAFATVEYGALRTDDRTVLHNGIGLLTIGAERGNTTLFDLLEAAQSDYFPVTRHENAHLILMRKVLINCMINPLTAILQVKNGELITNTYCCTMLEQLYKELMNAFPNMKTELSLGAVHKVCKSTSQNRSSMLVDREMGRKMEIETIVTSIIEKAHNNNKTLPLLSTLEKMLYALEEKEVS